MLLARFEQRVEQCRIDPRGGEHRVHHLIAERSAQRGATRSAAHTVRRGQHSRRQHANPDFWQEATTDLAREPRERSELDAVDANREKRGPCPLGDDGRPFVDLHERPGRGDAALGEDDAGRPALDGANHRPNRQRIGWIDRKCVDEHEKRLRPPLPGDKRIDSEDRLARQKRAEQQPVQERRVIRGDHRPRHGRTDVLEAFDFNPIQEPQHESHQAPGERAPQDPRRDERHRQRRDAAESEQFSHRHAAGKECRGGNAPPPTSPAH